jgi:hypothetical protein
VMPGHNTTTRAATIQPTPAAIAKPRDGACAAARSPKLRTRTLVGPLNPGMIRS